MDYRMEKPEMELRPSLLGYGCMRFPVNKDHTVDEEKAQQLIDRAMEAGVTYYDTAWFYHDGESEPMMGRLLSRYPRESYCLATKMPCAIIDSLEQAKDIFAKQFERLQTDYFDFYLLHSLSGRSWKKMLELGVVDFLEQCHREGKFRWFGFSFHDEYEAFEEILRARDWDFCQIQLNYMDQNIQAGLRGHDLALELGVPLVIMEPVKGGLLAQPPEEVLEPLRALDPDATPSSWAMRWVGSLPGVKVVLSGMGSMEQLEDNLNTFSQFRPLSDEERAAVDETARRLAQRVKNGCPARLGWISPRASVSGTVWPCIRTTLSPAGIGREWRPRPGPTSATAAAGVSGCALSTCLSARSWPRRMLRSPPLRRSVESIGKHDGQVKNFTSKLV